LRGSPVVSVSKIKYIVKYRLKKRLNINRVVFPIKIQR
jgi:hypothetical protein